MTKYIWTNKMNRIRAKMQQNGFVFDDNLAYPDSPPNYKSVTYGMLAAELEEVIESDGKDAALAKRFKKTFDEVEIVFARLNKDLGLEEKPEAQPEAKLEKVEPNRKERRASKANKAKVKKAQAKKKRKK